MIINDLYVKGVVVGKGKADAPLVVDPNAPLPSPVTAELFQPIAWRNPQIFHRLGSVQQREFLGCALLEIARHSAYFQTGKNGSSTFVGK